MEHEVQSVCVKCKVYSVKCRSVEPGRLRSAEWGGVQSVECKDSGVLSVQGMKWGV